MRTPTFEAEQALQRRVGRGLHDQGLVTSERPRLRDGSAAHRPPLQWSRGWTTVPLVAVPSLHGILFVQARPTRWTSPSPGAATPACCNGTARCTRSAT